MYRRAETGGKESSYHNRPKENRCICPQAMAMSAGKEERNFTEILELTGLDDNECEKEAQMSILIFDICSI